MKSSTRSFLRSSAQRWKMHNERQKNPVEATESVVGNLIALSSLGIAALLACFL
jgi:hypothetical protein